MSLTPSQFLNAEIFHSLKDVQVLTQRQLI